MIDEQNQGTLILYHTDGSVHTERCTARVANEPAFLAKLQALVGGYIEIVWVHYNGKRTAMVVNDSEFLQGLPINPRATEIYRQTACETKRECHHVIVGDVVVLEDVNLR